jgi:hypothetical protein
MVNTEKEAEEDGQLITPVSVIDAHGINPALQSRTARETLTALEADSSKDETTQSTWMDFLLRLTIPRFY